MRGGGLLGLLIPLHYVWSEALAVSRGITYGTLPLSHRLGYSLSLSLSLSLFQAATCHLPGIFWTAEKDGVTGTTRCGVLMRRGVRGGLPVRTRSVLLGIHYWITSSGNMGHLLASSFRRECSLLT